MKENKDYRMTPAQDDDGTETWDIRMLTGDFVETVFRFGAVQVDGENEQIVYNFTVIESPDDDATEENEELQKVVGAVLQDVIDNSIQDGSIEFTETDGS